MEVNEIFNIIDGIIELVSSDIFEKEYNFQLINDLRDIRNKISHYEDIMTPFNINLLNNIKHLHEIKLQLTALAERQKPERTAMFHMEAQKIFKLLHNKVNQIQEILYKHMVSVKISSYNSESYYEQQIKEIRRQKEELENTLNTIKKINAKNQIEKENQDKEIQEKEQQLQLAKQQIHNFQKELEEKKKQENAVEAL